jgi:hypothetical protein
MALTDAQIHALERASLHDCGGCAECREESSEPLDGDALRLALAELRQLRAGIRPTIDALEAMVRRWAPHSGLCCFMSEGKVTVTRESCVCDSVARDARDALGWE